MSHVLNHMGQPDQEKWKGDYYHKGPLNSIVLVSKDRKTKEGSTVSNEEINKYLFCE